MRSRLSNRRHIRCLRRTRKFFVSGWERALSLTNEERLRAVSWAKESHMSVSGISGSSFFNTQSANVQNPQQWQQEFQKLTQELQSGTLASPGANIQNTAQAQIAAAQPGTQSSAAPTAQNTDSGPPLLRSPQGTPEHSLNLRR